MRCCFSDGRPYSVRMLCSRSRELDEHDPDVLGHGQEHLADVLGLLLLVAVGAEPRQLGDAVDELGDLRAEPLLDVGQAELGVLGDVVEQRGLDGDRVDAELGQDLGTGDGMRDVRLAGRPALAGVGLDGQVECGIDDGQVGRRVMLGEGRLQGGPQRLEVDVTDGASPAGRAASGAAHDDRLAVALGDGRVLRSWFGRGHAPLRIAAVQAR